MQGLTLAGDRSTRCREALCSIEGKSRLGRWGLGMRSI